MTARQRRQNSEHLARLAAIQRGRVALTQKRKRGMKTRCAFAGMLGDISIHSIGCMSLKQHMGRCKGNGIRRVVKRMQQHRMRTIVAQIRYGKK